MQNKNLYFLLIPFLFSLFSINNLKGEEKPVETVYMLKLSSIGFPTSEKEKEAWGINDLKIFKNRLYIGHGDAVVNTGPTDIIFLI